MASFRNFARSKRDSSEYAAVADEERKSLNREYDAEGENETTYNAAEVLALNRSVKRTNLYLKIVIGLLCVVILSLLSLQGPDAYKKIKQQSSQLIKSPVPYISTEKVLFEKNPLYAQKPNPESDAAWNKLLPPGRGFVFIDDWKKYELPPGEDTPWGTIYSVAVFHQMHCLGQMRRFTYMFLDAIGKNGTEGEEERSKINDMFNVHDHGDHLHHCFDYLRQTIQCGGDMSMEWPRTEPDGRRFAVDGWGIPHECKNWGTIMDYMDKNHFNMSLNEEIAPLVGSSGQ